MVYVPGGLNPGSQIIVRGRVLPDETRFAINLKCGEDDDADIALHFNPRNDDGETVVRNTFQGGAWQEEERDTPRWVHGRQLRQPLTHNSCQAFL